MINWVIINFFILITIIYRFFINNLPNSMLELLMIKKQEAAFEVSILVNFRHQAMILNWLNIIMWWYYILKIWLIQRYILHFYCFHFSLSNITRIYRNQIICKLYSLIITLLQIYANLKNSLILFIILLLPFWNSTK